MRVLPHPLMCPYYKSPRAIVCRRVITSTSTHRPMLARGASDFAAEVKSLFDCLVLLEHIDTIGRCRKAMRVLLHRCPAPNKSSAALYDRLGGCFCLSVPSKAHKRALRFGCCPLAKIMEVNCCMLLEHNGMIGRRQRP
jgi:hypothetical protein